MLQFIPNILPFSSKWGSEEWDYPNARILSGEIRTDLTEREYKISHVRKHSHRSNMKSILRNKKSKPSSWIIWLPTCCIYVNHIQIPRHLRNNPRFWVCTMTIQLPYPPYDPTDKRGYVIYYAQFTDLMSLDFRM